MATVIRAELSKRSKYWIDRHRYYELKHFCLQYPGWKRAYEDIDEIVVPTSIGDHLPSSNLHSDLTCKFALMKSYYSEKILAVEKAAQEADPDLADYILKAVTEGLSFTTLKARLEMPCSRDMYYDRYRRFFWLLDKARD